MSDLPASIRSLGDLAATHELYSRGFGRSGLRLALNRGEIVRVRKGWYACGDLAGDVKQAARVGGRLACVSAARAHGLWVPGRPRALHVEVSPQSCQLRSRTDYRRRLANSIGAEVRVHWEAHECSGSRVLVSPRRSVKQVIRSEDAETGFVVAESARFTGQISGSEWQELLSGLPRRSLGALSSVGSKSESGTESAFKFRMLRHHLPVRQQVQIGPDRVDFLIGDCLVVEVDSRAHHDRVTDCARDARLSIRNYRVLRFYYEHVFNEWDLVEAAVLAAIIRGDHLSR
ncbi:MAG: DUF559 domain-containing protein [Homoserinimonas sp.]